MWSFAPRPSAAAEDASPEGDVKETLGPLLASLLGSQSSSPVFSFLPDAGVWASCTAHLGGLPLFLGVCSKSLALGLNCLDKDFLPGPPNSCFELSVCSSVVNLSTCRTPYSSRCHISHLTTLQSKMSSHSL